ncbi:MAG: DUF4957 domain-containing protein [Bacteroidaceae bacterium]|nr:DUF4957 domain-containing protein [Bacteroidaceae bacterium]
MKIKLLTLPTLGKTLSAGTLVLAGMAVVSCADGFDSKEIFEPTVKNSTMLSPDSKDIVITASADGANQTISWPVVSGAGGYRLTVKDVTDANNPIVLVNDSLIDGCSCYIKREEDKNYVLTLKTLGNAKLNNQDAATATEVSFNSFAAAFAQIPAGDLAEYFEKNPLPKDLSSNDLIFDLEAGKEYTLNGTIDFQGQRVTLRTPSTNYAKIIYGEGSHLRTCAGFTLKNLELNGAALTANNSALLELSDQPIEAIKGIQVGSKESSYYDIQDPVVFRNCNMTAVNSFVLYDNGKSYSLANLIIDNCLIHLTTLESAGVANNAIFNTYAGGVRNLTMQNTTVWSTSAKPAKYVFRYNNGYRYDRAGVTDLYVTVQNTTMYNVCKTGHICNYDGVKAQKASHLKMTNSIFVDCASGQICRRFLGGSAGADATFANNTYWFDGAAENYAEYDKSETAIDEDPNFVDAANGNFTPQGAGQVAKQIGDPRWLKK